MPGLFDLESADDLCAKLRHDHGRVLQARADAYAAFDFVVTAWHLAEWRFGREGAYEVASRIHILQVCHELANGAKHFYSDNRKKDDRSVKGSQRRSLWAPGIWGDDVWATGAWDTLIVLLDGEALKAFGPFITITHLAEQVMTFFSSTEGGCPPGPGGAEVS